MSPWWLVGCVIIFLCIAVILSLISVVRSKGAESIPGSATFGASMVVICSIVILAIFVAYFNGMFNSFKTTTDAMNVKYDYLRGYSAVNILPSIMSAPATASTKPRKDAFLEVFPNFIPLATVAIKDLKKEKKRVRNAIRNVVLRKDSIILTNYTFSLNPIKFGNEVVKKYNLFMEYEKEATLVLQDLIKQNGNLVFDIEINKEKISVDMITILACYIIFAQTYPQITEECIKNNGCIYKFDI